MWVCSFFFFFGGGAVLFLFLRVFGEGFEGGQPQSPRKEGRQPHLFPSCVCVCVCVCVCGVWLLYLFLQTQCWFFVGGVTGKTSQDPVSAWALIRKHQGQHWFFGHMGADPLSLETRVGRIRWQAEGQLLRFGILELPEFCANPARQGCQTKVTRNSHLGSP